MTSNAKRAATLVRALHAGLDRDRSMIEELFTADVRAWTPASSAASITELLREFDRRDRAFSDFDLDATPLDVGGDFACVEWRVGMTHTGPLVVGDETVVEPTGLRVALHGATVAEFEGDRICGLRQYWDEFAVFEQLGLLRDGDD
jgi:ketosteroid isomerase-like protein